ncbi:MAG TPA: hypothetical protein VFP54_07895 [Acidimicrobiales bacterium]|nr:hypothetical protein [Acidimicrobiales bacterium]
MATVVAAARSSHAVAWGDQAVLQLCVDRAWRGAQLVGPYSRFGWSHPGPDVFYLLALPYRLLGSDAAALMAASVLLAAASALATVVFVRRWFPPPAAWWAGAVVLAGWAALGPATVADTWNPVWVIGPTASFVVAAAALGAGRPWALPWMVAFASLVVQTDVSTAAVVAVVGVTALAAAIVAWRRPAGGPAGARGAGTPLAVSVVVVAVLWAPAVAQQVAGPGPGNLSALIRFATAGHPAHGTGEAVRAVAGALWPPLRGRLAGAAPSLASAGAVVALVAGAAALIAFAGWRRRLPAAAAAGAVVVAGLAAAVAGATRVTGPLYPYLTEWMSALWVPLVVGAGSLTAPGRGRRPLWAVGAAAVAGTAVVVQVALVPPTGPAQGPTVAALWASVRDRLPAPRAGPVDVRVGVPARWPWAAGILVDLTHGGWTATTQPEWLFLFGRSFAPAARPAAVVTVTDDPRTGAPAAAVTVPG